MRWARAATVTTAVTFFVATSMTLTVPAPTFDV